MPIKKKSAQSMSAAHKAALAEGRDQGRAIRAYLEALESNKPKRGRQRTPESVAKRLHDVEAQLDTADTLKRLQLFQERFDLRAEQARFGSMVDTAELEDRFVAVAASYGERKGLTYPAWRAVGVDAAVLKRAGIPRTSPAV